MTHVPYPDSNYKEALDAGDKSRNRGEQDDDDI